MKRLAIAAVPVAALSLALASAGPATAAAALSGTYQTKIAASPLGARLIGTWSIKFSHGNYKVFKDGTAVVRGKYTISGSKVTLGHESGPASCPATGHYRYKISGKKLKFTRLSDGTSACSGRAAVLSGRFTRVH